MWHWLHVLGGNMYANLTRTLQAGEIRRHESWHGGTKGLGACWLHELYTQRSSTHTDRQKQGEVMMSPRSLRFIRTLDVNNASRLECLIDCIVSQGKNSIRGLGAPSGGPFFTQHLQFCRCSGCKTPPIITTPVRREHRWTSSRNRWRTQGRERERGRERCKTPEKRVAVCHARLNSKKVLYFFKKFTFLCFLKVYWVDKIYI